VNQIREGILRFVQDKRDRETASYSVCSLECGYKGMKGDERRERRLYLFVDEV
jgi:hypothetical protein